MSYVMCAFVCKIVGLSVEPVNLLVLESSKQNKSHPFFLFSHFSQNSYFRFLRKRLLNNLKTLSLSLSLFLYLCSSMSFKIETPKTKNKKNSLFSSLSILSCFIISNALLSLLHVRIFNIFHSIFCLIQSLFELCYVILINLFCFDGFLIYLFIYLYCRVVVRNGTELG